MGELTNVVRNAIASAKRLTVQAYAKHLEFCGIAGELAELSNNYIWRVRIEKGSDFERAFTAIENIEKALTCKYKMSNDADKFIFSELITCVNDYKIVLSAILLMVRMDQVLSI